MKKLILVTVAVLIVQPLFSQYKEDRLIFNPKNYEKKKSDPYNPALNGIASFIIPGLGQIAAGETNRGVSQFLCYSASVLLLQIAANNIDEETETFTSKGAANIGSIGLAGFVVVTIGSAIDAIRVSKVKNMSYQEKFQTTSIGFSPTTIRYKHHSQIAAGIKFSFQLN